MTDILFACLRWPNRGNRGNRRAGPALPSTLALRPGLIGLGCGAALLAACALPAWGGAVEPDHPFFALGMGNGGHPADPGMPDESVRQRLHGCPPGDPTRCKPL